MKPPGLARRLLAWRLPASHRSVIIADLDDEFARYIAPGRARWRAHAWYWRQAIGSLRYARHLGRLTVHSGSHRSGRPWQAVGTDLRFAWRMCRRQPVFALAAAATLAVGIAVTTASLSIVHAVLLRPLPYDDPSRLVHVGEIDRSEIGTAAGSAGRNLSWPDFLDYRAGQQSFAAFAGYTGGSRTLTGFGPPDRLPMTAVTGDFFPMLGLRPAMGRLITAADTDPAAPPVVVLAHGTWVRRLGGRADILGTTITLTGQPTTVVGVLPAAFQFPLRGHTELWLPLRPSAAQAERRFFHWLSVIARLAPGATIDQAQADLDRIGAGFASIDPQYHATTATAIESLDTFVVGEVRTTLFVLLGAAVCVLLIACTNVAGLLVARTAARSREMDVRRALGASRLRLVGQMVLENTVLALPGGLVGLALGIGLVQSFVTSLPPAQRVSLPHLQNLTLQPAIVVAVLGITFALSLALGLVSAWRPGARAVHASLRGVAGSDRHGARLRTALVIAQVALTAVLLTGAGLMGRSVLHLLTVSPGFDPEGLMTAVAAFSPARSRDADMVRAAHGDLLERIAALPGVTGVSTIDQLSLTGAGNSGTFVVQAQPGAPERETRIRSVAMNYFEVMGIPIRQGRPFTRTDGPGSPRVLLVNETFARTYFAGEPVGQRIAFPFFDDRPFWEIVGVVGDEQLRGLDSEMLPVAYFAHAQVADNAFSLVVRTSVDPATLEGPVRTALGKVDPLAPLFAVRTMSDIVQTSDAVFRRRTVLTLVGLFAAAAVILAVVGLYGLVTQIVAERTREIGVRMTLGARPRQIAGTVLRRGLVPAVAGAVAGLAITLVAARALSGLLFGVSPADPLTLSAVAAGLVGIALGACVVPARRAMAIDPVEAVRGD